MSRSKQPGPLSESDKNVLLDALMEFERFGDEQEESFRRLLDQWQSLVHGRSTRPPHGARRPSSR